MALNPPTGLELRSGPLNVADLNKFLQTNYGTYEGLKNTNTPEARAFVQKLNAFQSLRNEVAGRAERWGALGAEDQKRARDAAKGVSDSRLAAQKSQMRTDSSPDTKDTPPKKSPDASESDPYKKSNGKLYRPGPSTQDVANGAKAFHEGDKGEGVKALQKRLLEAGYNLGPKGADGYFGPQTARAAREFFEKHKDLGGEMNKRALERVNGVVEGIRSTRGGGTDAR